MPDQSQTPHSSLRKEAARQEHTTEEQQLADAQTLATPESQEELTSSQTKQTPEQEHGKSVHEHDLSSEEGNKESSAKKGGTY